MKKQMKSLLIALLLCFFAFSFSSCEGGIKGEEARAFVNDFFAAIVAEDYDQAESFLHPDRPADLEAFLSRVETEEQIDFQKGIEIRKYTGFSSSYYDSTVDGSRYELRMKILSDEKSADFTIEIVKNENGYGIYNFDLNVEQ